jgi:hypothetical protein
MIEEIMLYEDFSADCLICEKVLDILIQKKFIVDLRDITKLDKTNEFDLSVQSQVCFQNNALPVLYYNGKFIDATKDGWENELQTLCALSV